MQNFTFVIKHIYGNANKVVDALSMRCLILQEFQVKTLGFDHLKEMYHNDLDFGEAFKVFFELIGKYHTDFSEYIIQNDLLFKGYQLCIPRYSMRLNIIKEKHFGGIDSHFGIDKIYK